MMVSLTVIQIPPHFTPPAFHKIRAAEVHYKQGRLHPLKVEKTDSGWLLRDGYARYLAAIKCKATELEADLWTTADDIAQHNREKEKAAL